MLAFNIMSLRFCCLRLRLKWILLTVFFIGILDFFGAFTHYFEIDFYKDFHYPMEGDVLKYARQIRFGQTPDIVPINLYNYTFIFNSTNKCNNDDIKTVPKLVFIIKSKIDHFRRRNAIRQSWGYERRFSDVIVRTVFVLGVSKAISTSLSTNNYNNNPQNHENVDIAEEDLDDIQKLIDIETENFQDIVQANFHDTYFNNTIKTMIGVKWAIKFCSRSQFYMFVDDDYYISTKNVLRFIRNPVNYPEYLEEANETLRKLARKLSQSNALNSVQNNTNINWMEINRVFNADYSNTIENKKYLKDIKQFLAKQQTQKLLNIQNSMENNNAIDTPIVQQRKILDMELPSDVKLFSGFVFSSAPHRHRSSKWHVTLNEYPWHMWPSYVSAGAFILSREALIELYYVSMYTKHFKFDDIFLGLVALKAGIELLHSEEFYFHKAMYTGSHSYRYVIASHGYDNPDELMQIWSESRAAGHA